MFRALFFLSFFLIRVASLVLLGATNLLFGDLTKVRLFDKNELALFESKIKEAGSEMIRLSIAIAYSDSTTMLLSNSLSLQLTTISGSIFLAYFAYRYEKESARYASKLADSLKSRWYDPNKSQKKQEWWALTPKTGCTNLILSAPRQYPQRFEMQIDALRRCTLCNNKGRF